MNLRKYSFWLQDKLKGGVIRNHYNDIRAAFFNNGSKREEQLKSLLLYAIKNIDFYRNISPSTPLSLNNFPVLNKSIIKENLNRLKSPLFNEETLFKEYTSGSTGTPLMILQDQGKRKRAAADTYFFSEVAGYHIGKRLYYSRVWNKLNKKSKIASFIQNIIMWDSSRIDDAGLKDFLDVLEKDRSDKSVLVFASTLSALYHYILKTDYKPKTKVNCFITMSESLPENVKEGISSIFNTNVVARYSNCECGIMGQQCSHENEYHLNHASFIIEILKLDSDEPASPGAAGRIVVTDLYNYAMPIIRYDTGDIGVLENKSKCGLPGPVISRVEGRRVDCFYSTSGKMLSPYVVNNTMWRYNDIIQYQLIQQGEKDYEIKLNIAVDSFPLEFDMLNELKNYLGQDANIKISYVNEIPLLSSGKRKQVVCNYSPHS